MFKKYTSEDNWIVKMLAGAALGAAAFFFHLEGTLAENLGLATPVSYAEAAPSAQVLGVYAIGYADDEDHHSDHEDDDSDHEEDSNEDDSDEVDDDESEYEDEDNSDSDDLENEEGDNDDSDHEDGDDASDRENEEEDVEDVDEGDESDHEEEDESDREEGDDSDDDVYKRLRTTDNLHVRNAPAGDIVTTALSGAALTRSDGQSIERNGHNWVKVHLDNGIVGWVASQYVKQDSEVRSTLVETRTNEDIDALIEKLFKEIEYLRSLKLE